MDTFSRDLVQGMEEAAAFVEGRKAAARVDVADVRATDSEPSRAPIMRPHGGCHAPLR
ncbi:MAG: hypothetical protein ACREFP_23025 [Acetobacteraceae bacterium]